MSAGKKIIPLTPRPTLKKVPAPAPEFTEEELRLMKQETNQLREAIIKKLKDPKIAKKAAQIISELLNKVNKKTK
jgi:hypothetical protein